MASFLASTSRQTICPVCHLNPTKYTCPGCTTPTCSLACSKNHKTKTGCSGQRNKAAYIPMNRYGWGQMMGDYAYLEDVTRRTTEWKAKSRDPNNARKGKGKREVLQSYLGTKDINMELLPLGMSRRKLNQSTWDPKFHTAYLTVEVRTHSGTTKKSTITHRHRLDARIDAIIDAHPSSWCTFGDLSVNLTDTLGVALVGKSFVEYPVFDVWEERPKKLGASVIKGILGGYESDEDTSSVKKKTAPVTGLASLGDYYSSDSDVDGGDQSQHSETEVDWGESDDDMEECGS